MRLGRIKQCFPDSFSVPFGPDAQHMQLRRQWEVLLDRHEANCLIASHRQDCWHVFDDLDVADNRLFDTEPVWSASENRLAYRSHSCGGRMNDDFFREG
jgi:hypothetical protein